VTGSLAGGDFFKTVRVEGRLVAVLGDVMGHGSVSAARAGQLHSVIATLALEGHGPGALLGRLASGIEQIMDLELATLLVCSYDPETRRMTSATAGHPPPLIAPLDGCPFYLVLEPGPPIGVSTGPYEEQSYELETGSTMVLFSDGLVERRGESISTGLEKLRRAVSELRLPPEAVADHVLDELGCTGGGEDDVALLVLSHL
jgi:serine phosphatase RsbU (regulator of sigma subunit)